MEKLSSRDELHDEVVDSKHCDYEPAFRQLMGGWHEQFGGGKQRANPPTLGQPSAGMGSLQRGCHQDDRVEGHWAFQDAGHGSWSWPSIGIGRWRF